MKKEVYYGKGMRLVKERYPELYAGINCLNEAVYNGRALDYKTQKLIAVGIAASKSDESATEKQIRSAIAELGVTEEELVDVLRVVLLTTGMPAFTKGMRILEEMSE